MIDARTALLAQVLSERHTKGRIIVLSARFQLDPMEDMARHEWAKRIGRPMIEPMASNTPEELRVALPMLVAHGTLVTSSYHQLRAFLTAIALLSKPWDVKLWNAPMPWRNDLLNLEMEKIDQYQAQGHVASYDEGLAYLQWRDRDD